MTTALATTHGAGIEEYRLLRALRRNGGFTFDPRTGQTLSIGDTSGFAIALPGTERPVSLDPDEFTAALADLTNTAEVLLNTTVFVGGWYSTERGIYLIELSEIRLVSRAAAVALGQARQQEAILDMATGEFISTLPTAVVAA